MSAVIEWGLPGVMISLGLSIMSTSVLIIWFSGRKNDSIGPQHAKYVMTALGIHLTCAIIVAGLMIYIYGSKQAVTQQTRQILLAVLILLGLVMIVCSSVVYTFVSKSKNPGEAKLYKMVSIAMMIFDIIGLIACTGTAFVMMKVKGATSSFHLERTQDELDSVHAMLRDAQSSDRPGLLARIKTDTFLFTQPNRDNGFIRNEPNSKKRPLKTNEPVEILQNDIETMYARPELDVDFKNPYAGSETFGENKYALVRVGDRVGFVNNRFIEEF